MYDVKTAGQGALSFLHSRDGICQFSLFFFFACDRETGGFVCKAGSKRI